MRPFTGPSMKEPTFGHSEFFAFLTRMYGSAVRSKKDSTI